MFITSFGEQNITYRCCSNLRSHLFKDFHPDRNINVTDAVKAMLEEQAHLINNARDVMLKYLT